MVGVECIWVAEIGFGSRTELKLSRPPSSTFLDAQSIVSNAATGETHPFGNGYKTYTSSFA